MSTRPTIPRDTRGRLVAACGSAAASLCLAVMLAAPLPAQVAQRDPLDAPALQQVLQRLERIEQANRALAAEVQALRRELAAQRETATAAPAEPAQKLPPYLGERLEVQERRIEEQAETKVEASQKFPLQITGMALFNFTGNNQRSTEVDTNYGGSGGHGPTAASFRQSMIGLIYRGPETLWGGKVRGSIMFDLASDYTDEYESRSFGRYGFEWPGIRLRTASLGIDWKTRSVTAGFLKPLISPREPESFARVAEPPLSDSGNLWLWLPQVRAEQRFTPAEGTTLRAQVAVVQTAETWAATPVAWRNTLAPSRPAIQARFELAQDFGAGMRFEIAPGFHRSTTHVAGTSVPSQLFSLDGMIRPIRTVELSGAMYTGKNAASLGSMWQGFTILGPRQVIPIRATGAWAQASWRPTSRLTFNAYGGQERDRQEDMPFGGRARSRAYAANVIYRIAPNVLLSAEAGQRRVNIIRVGDRLRNSYDLAIAYLF